MEREDAAGTASVQRRKDDGEKRAKKRPRVETSVPETEQPASEDEGELVEEEEAEARLTRRSTSPQAALPLFPMPKQPDAPSKATLALQGLDHALAEAEWVDALQTVSLDVGSAEDARGVSDKTRERLKELGISELFAGMPPSPRVADERSFLSPSTNCGHSIPALRPQTSVALPSLRPSS